MTKNNAQPIFANALIEHQLDIFRAEVAISNDIHKTLKKLEKSLIALVLELNPTGHKRARDLRRAQERFLNGAAEIVRSHFNDIQKSTMADFLSLAEVEALFIASAVNNAIGSQDIVTVPKSSEIQALADNAFVLGSPLVDWFSSAESKYTAQFTNTMQGAFLEKLTDAETIKRLRSQGMTDRSKRGLSTLVRTASASITANVDRSIYNNNPQVFKGIQQISTFDSRTSTVCQAYAGKTWDLEYKPMGHSLPYNGGVPRHPNCRSRERGVLLDKFGVPEKDLSFDSYLKRLSKARQNDLLGDKVARYWRDGKINSVSQLVDGAGKTIPVDDVYLSFTKHKKAYLANVSEFQVDGVGRAKNIARLWTEAYSSYQYGQFKQDMNHAFDAKLTYNASGVKVNARLQGGSDGSFDMIARTFDVENKIVTHDFLTVKKNHQGQGATKTVFAESMRVYESMGIKSVGVHAALDRGAYAWAKYGFVPEQSEWNRLRVNLSRKLDGIKADLPEKTYIRSQKLLNQTSPYAIWDVVDLKDMHEGVKLGKYLLHHEDWWGSLKLNDKLAMQRFWRYVGQ